MRTTRISILAAALFVSTGLFAQEMSAPVKSPAKQKEENRPKPAKPVSDPSGKTKPAKKKKGPSEEKIRHAEERSKGKAFSGKGEGGDKNRVEPAAQPKGKGENKPHDHQHDHEGQGHDHKH